MIVKNGILQALSGAPVEELSDKSNAAINILREGLRIGTAGTAEIA